MLKRVNQGLNFVIYGFLGAFTGHGIFVYWDYKTHPVLYAMQSAPWYTRILLDAAVTVVVVAIAIVAKLIIRRKIGETKS